LKKEAIIAGAATGQMSKPLLLFSRRRVVVDILDSWLR
jgi:hypothetical protein